MARRCPRCVAVRHPDPSAEDKRRRSDLLDQAVAAGSWRARLFDLSWSLWLQPSSAKGQQHLDALWKMAREGNPAAMEAVLRWTGGMVDDMPTRIAFLKAAIDHGNPRAMSDVGFDLGARTRNMRPLGLAMMRCAAAQGHAEAYDGLAQVAWQEGRWVDAHREWQRGANLGCDRCLSQMEDVVPTRPRADPVRGTYGQEPRVAALRAFYDTQFLYGVSRLVELRVDAPRGMWVQWSDEELVAVIRTRIRMYGVP